LGWTVIATPASFEGVSRDDLALAFLAWLVGMVRPKGFGAWPAALWIGLLLIALLCSGRIGFFEFVR
jgi:hypothetical protein